jgi:hypothetical protein
MMVIATERPAQADSDTCTAMRMVETRKRTPATSGPPGASARAGRDAGRVCLSGDGKTVQSFTTARAVRSWAGTRAGGTLAFVGRALT